MQSATPKMPRRSTDISVGTDPMTPNTEEARRLASELRSVIPPKNHEASRILDSAAFTLRLLAADVNKLEAENEALRADKVRLAEIVKS